MEMILVWSLVALAATWLGFRALRRRRRSSTGACGGCCDGCSCPAPEPGKRAEGTKLPVIGGPGKVAAVALGASLALAPVAVHAADTVETFDAGAADLELYLGVDGLRAPRSERTTFGELVAGYGVAEWLSVFLATTIAADGGLGAVDPDFRIGAFATVVDRGLFDLDLILEAGGGGPGMDRYQVVPGLEANVDAASPLGPVGLFLRAALPFSGQSHTDRGRTVHETSHALELTPGCHVTPAEGHQLLLEWAFTRSPETDGVPAAWENGGLALGYNVGLTDTFELITQATFASHPSGRGLAPGLMLGVIATVPGLGG